jgi:hypothetical protein
VCLCVCALLASATPAAHAQGLRISVFGDSVLLGAADQIVSVLSGNDVSVDAHENVSLLGALATLDAARPAIGDVVVLDLGYNDGTDLAAWRDRIDRAMAILDGVPKVIWLTQAEFASGRAEMNGELYGAATRHPNLELVDWNAIVAAQPDAVYDDGIHLTPSGRTAMADVVKQRVDAFVAARIAATSTTTSTTTTTTSTTTTSLPPSARPLPSDGSDEGDDNQWIAPTVAGVLLVVGLVTVVMARRHRQRPGGS